MEATLRSAVDLTVVSEILTQANVFWKGLPKLPIMVAHCVFVASLAPDAKQHFLLHFWLTYLGGFAGGVLSALLLMNPARAPLSILSNNTAGLTWVLCWWIMTYSPLAGLLNAIHSWRPVRAVTRTCVQFMRASLIMARVQLASELFPGVYLAPIIVGTVSACGGKSTYDAIRHVYGLATGPAEITVPTSSFRTAFLGSVLYYVGCVCPLTRVLTLEAGSGALLSLFVAQTLVSELTGTSVDWSELLLRGVLRLSFIPYPEGVPKPLPTHPTRTTPPAPPPHTKLQNGHAPRPFTPTTVTSTVNIPANGLASHPLKARHGRELEGVANGGRDGDSAERGASDGTGSNGEDTAPVAVPHVDVDTIRAALQRSAGGKAKGAGGGTKPNDGWQVVQARKKAAATKETADKKVK